MKRNTILTAALILGMMMLGACGTGKGNVPADSGEGERQELADTSSGKQTLEEIPSKEQEPAADPEETPETNPETGGNIYIVMEPSVMEYKAEDGTVVYKAERTIPVVTISDNEEGAAAINKYIENNFPADEDEMLEMAKEDYAALGKENWYGYETGSKFSSQRKDSEVISFFIISYWDMGGAHPNSWINGLNFSTADGEVLTLEDVVTDKEAATEIINEFLLAETKKEEYEGMFFEDYENSIGDILTEDSWYLGEDGFHIIVNEYIISPHAAGIMDFVIPYAEADFLKDEFRK